MIFIDKKIGGNLTVLCIASSVSQLLFLYTIIFLHCEFKKAHKKGIEGKGLWEEIIYNRARAYISGSIKILVFTTLLAIFLRLGGFLFGCYCSDQDFENVGKTTRKLCHKEYQHYKDLKCKEYLHKSELEHRLKMNEYDIQFKKNTYRMLIDNINKK